MIAADGGGSYFTAIPGDPGAVRQAAATIGRLSADMGSRGSSLSAQAGDATGSGWTGSAATQFESLAGQLGQAHADVGNCLGTLPGALSAFADALEAAQQQIARAERLMGQAEDDYASSLAALPAPAAGADAGEALRHQAALDSLGDTFNHQSATATRLADGAVADHRAAVARLIDHVSKVTAEAHGLQGTLTRIGDALGIPVAVLSALSTVAMLRAAERFATVGSAFATTLTQESRDLAAFLDDAVARGTLTEGEAVARAEGFLAHAGLAGQMFENGARADLAAGGLLNLGRFTGAAKWAGRGAGVLGIVGDVYTIWHPDEGGGWGDAERGVAAANAAGTTGLLAVDGLGLAETGGLMAADATLGWVPVAGQVLVVGSGLYLLGNYLYAHAQWFHDGIDAAGTGLVDAGEAIGQGAVATGEAIGHGAAAVVDTVGDGLSTAGHSLGSAAGSVASFFGL